MIFFIFFLACLGLPPALRRPLSASRLSTNKERPMLLGLTVYLAVLAACVIFFNDRQSTATFLINMLFGASIVLITGLLDDIKNLSVVEKLTGQIAAACAAVFLGIRTSIVFIPEWMNIVLSLFWIVGLVNAFNFLDIMDGLCVGISLIICAFFLSLSLISGVCVLSAFFWALAGAILAAFIYNKPKASFYLGDSGSMLLGYVFACSALQLSYAVDTGQGLALFVPLMIMSLPIFDLAFTVYARKVKGISVFKKSPDHMALLLRDKGYGRFKVLAVMYTICLITGLNALLLQCLPPAFKPWVLSFFIFMASGFIFICAKITRAHN
ncbi:MAG: MraY family glycosyltransferase [Candidatus Omnitrophota bacterium]|jgi:UDP-GlcNAc:undecaprenyl-phosphate GlcNAc-1-phosphate transferase